MRYLTQSVIFASYIQCKTLSCIMQEFSLHFCKTVFFAKGSEHFLAFYSFPSSSLYERSMNTSLTLRSSASPAA